MVVLNVFSVFSSRVVLVVCFRKLVMFMFSVFLLVLEV